MLMREVIDAWSLIDRPDTSGELVHAYFAENFGDPCRPQVTRLGAPGRGTDVVTWTIPGAQGKTRGGSARTLAVAGRLGGVGIRPRAEGTVSDADGAVVALAAAIKLSRSLDVGDRCRGDVVIVTQVCPGAPTRDVPVKGQLDHPAPLEDLLRCEAPEAADALISVDTTRSHYFLNHTGIAVSPTLVNGYLLRLSEDLLQVCAEVTSEPPVALPITMQDITPHGNGVFRINSIMQPARFFRGPVVGLASVSRHPIRGITTGANRPQNLEEAARFCVEVARRFGRGALEFFDPVEYERLVGLYGSMEILVRGGADVRSAQGEDLV